MKLIGRFLVFCLVFLGLVCAALYVVGGKQYEFVSTIDINATPEQVFRVVSQLGNAAGNERQLLQLEPDRTTSTAREDTTTYSGYLGPIRVEVHDSVTSEIPGQWQAIKTTSNVFQGLSAVRLVPQANRATVTRVQHVTWVSYNGVYRIIAPLVQISSQESVNRGLQRLKAQVEQGLAGE